MSNDEDLLDYLSGGALDPEFSYRSMKRSLSTDWRKDKPSMSDVSTQYDEYLEFTKSDNYRLISIARNLISDRYDTDANHLTKVLKDKYNFTSKDCESTLRTLANSKDITVRKEWFNGGIKIRKNKN